MTLLKRILLSSGVAPLYIYFGLYCLWLGLNLPVSSLLNIFVVLHFLLGTYYCGIGANSLFKRKVSYESVCFWSLIFLAFLIPGAYLEYPSDPFEHFRRIVSWQTSETISSNSLWNKSFYLWYWSWLQLVPIELRRCMLGFISAVTQLILVLQVFSLSRAFGFDKKYSYIQIVAFIALFGTSIFGFRYYALATTILAYAAYLRGVELLITPWRGNSRRDIYLRLLELLLLSAFIALNHLQELLFLIIAAILVTTSLVAKALHNRSRIGFYLSTAFLLIAGIGGGALAKIYMPEIFGVQPPIFLNAIGSFNIFAPTARVINTLGIHGFISIIAAVLLFSRAPLLSLFTIAPFGLLLFPPSFILFSSFLDSENTTYRLLFLFPSSFMFVYALQTLAKKFSYFSKRLVLETIAISLIVIISGLIPWEPWSGRLFFQFYQPLSSRALVELDQTAEWLNNNMPNIESCYFISDADIGPFLKWKEKRIGEEKPCLVITDSITAFHLSSQFGQFYWMKRLKPQIFGSNLMSCAEKITPLLSLPYLSTVAVLISKEQKSPDNSLVSTLSKHWRQKNASIADLLSPGLADVEQCLVAQNWKRETVAPSYVLLRPVGP